MKRSDFMKQDRDWQQDFKNNCTKMAFNLVLTRPMMEYLCACSDDVYWDRRTYGRSITFPDNFLSTEAALTRRGLVRRKANKRLRSVKEMENEKHSPPVELTPAGEAIIELLKVGGLFITAQAALEKMNARPGRW